MHPPEPIYPCYLPVLGEFNRMTPHEGPSTTLPDVGACPESTPGSARSRAVAPAGRRAFRRVPELQRRPRKAQLGDGGKIG